MINVATNPQNKENMWRIIKELFPLHRTLVGPGYTQSLKMIQRYLPVKIHEFPSGQKAFDWIIPKAFKVNAAYIKAPDGSKPIDFEKCCYHIWNYSVPFRGKMTREELLKHISTDSNLPDAVPLRDSYYKPRWGLSASQNQVNSLPDGTYEVVIDTELYDDYLRIGEYYLPGKVDKEILYATYLCHPMGANDNLSGVVLAAELFKILEQTKDRYYSYRLIIIPETIGSITYIANFPENIKKTVGGFGVSFVGDGAPFTYKRSHSGNTFVDRAVEHALEFSGKPYRINEYRQYGGDERQFNAPGVRIPFGHLARSPSLGYPQYHTSQDDLTLVTPDNLLESLEMYCRVVNILERNHVYKPHFITEPFLSGHGIYPFDLGVGTGDKSAYGSVADAFYDLMGDADGKTDLLGIAERRKKPIFLFDRPVADFLRTGLLSQIEN